MSCHTICNNFLSSSTEHVIVQALDVISSNDAEILGATKGEIFLLLDDVYGHKDEDLILVVNGSGCLGYISSAKVAYSVIGNNGTWPYIESLIARYVNDTLCSSSDLQKDSRILSVSSGDSTYTKQNSSKSAIQALNDKKYSFMLMKKDTMSTTCCTSNDSCQKKEDSNSDEGCHFSSCNGFPEGSGDHWKEHVGSKDFAVNDCSEEESIIKEEINLKERFVILLSELKDIVLLNRHNMTEVTILLDDVVCLIENMCSIDAQKAFQVLGPTVVLELAKRYLMARSKDLRLSLSLLLRTMCGKNSLIGKWLMQSDLPIILMTDIIYERTEGKHLAFSLQILMSMLRSCRSCQPSSLVDGLIRKSLLPYLLSRLEVISKDKKVPFMMADILLRIYAIPSLTDEVISKMLKMEFIHIPAYFIKLADKRGARSWAWKLLLDLLSYEATDSMFTTDHVENLIDLVEKKITSPEACNEDFRLCLKFVEALCQLQHVQQKSKFSRKLHETVCRSFSLSRSIPEKDKQTMWALLKTLEVNVQKEIKRANELQCNKAASVQQMTFQMSLYGLTVNLSHKLKKLAIFKEGDNLPSKAESVTTLLREICKVIMAFNLNKRKCKGEEKFKYNLKDVEDGFYSMDCIFFKFCSNEIHQLIMEVLLELCCLFPTIVCHALCLKLVPCVFQDMQNYLSRDIATFELSAALLTRLLSANLQLPIVLLKYISGDYVRVLIDEIEWQSAHGQHGLIETILSLILAINLHRKHEVMHAFCGGNCPRTLEAILTYLHKGVDPLTNYEYSIYHINQGGSECQYSLLKIYSDLLENGQTAILLEDDCLQSVINFTCSHLTFLYLTPVVPELMAYYLSNILCNCQYLFKSKDLTVPSIEDAFIKFSQGEISVKLAICLLCSIQEDLTTKKIKNWKLQSLSCCNLYNKSMGTYQNIREAMSLSSLEHKMKNFTRNHEQVIVEKQKQNSIQNVFGHKVQVDLKHCSPVRPSRIFMKQLPYESLMWRRESCNIKEYVQNSSIAKNKCIASSVTI